MCICILRIIYVSRFPTEKIQEMTGTKLLWVTTLIYPLREFLLSELSSNTIYYLNVSLFNAVINTNRVGPFISIGPVSTNNSGIHSKFMVLISMKY